MRAHDDGFRQAVIAGVSKGTGAIARAVIATAFACLDAASVTWVASDGEDDVMDLYDECVAAVRG
jgi:hypothetical protein